VSVTTERVRLVSVQTAVTVTPGSTAPVVSITVPPMSPVVRCAAAGAIAAISKKRHNPMWSKPRRMCPSLRENKRPFRKKT
jgi:hypothetical protein